MKQPIYRVLAFLVVLASPAWAWWPEGHQLVDEAAVLILPQDMPEFFRKGAATIACFANDADLWKERAVPALKQEEEPNHFLDMELLQGRPLPKTRKEFVALCQELKVDPYKAGTLPYAVQEWHDRLVLAFAEYRKRPDDPRIQMKILVLAGLMSHYTGDAAQPLHTTIHYNGRVGPDGKTPRSGIHYNMDALPGSLKLTAQQIAEGLKVEAVPDVFELIRAVILKSHGLVDRVYELEAKLPRANAEGGYKKAEGGGQRGKETPGTIDKEVADLGLETCRTGAQFTAMIWYSAWVKSADVKLPDWYKLYPAGAPRTGPKQ